MWNGCVLEMDKKYTKIELQLLLARLVVIDRDNLLVMHCTAKSVNYLCTDVTLSDCVLRRTVCMSTSSCIIARDNLPVMHWVFKGKRMAAVLVVTSQFALPLLYL